MISPNELEDLKSRLQKLIVKDTKATIKTFKEALPTNSPRLVDLLNIEGQFNDYKKKKIKQIISVENEQIISNQIRDNLITLISSLELKDFEASNNIVFGKTKKRNLIRLVYLLLGIGLIALIFFFMPKSDNLKNWFSLPSNKTGHLLYKIPERMQLNEETECIVRIAFDSVSIIRDIIREEVKMESINTSEKMSVELINSKSKAAFKINNILNDKEQFIERDDYTEWRFGVTPLIEGSHNLTIKVTVLKKIDGEYASKNISYSKDIEIVSNALVENNFAFQTTGKIVSDKSGKALDNEIQTEKNYVENENPPADKESPAVSELLENISINFAFNSTQYYQKDEIEEYLYSLLYDLEQEEVQILLSGHTDNIGSEKYNLELGKKRAEKIAQLLIKNGFKRSLIKVISKGESEPIASNQSEEGRSQNRRVEISLDK